MAWRIVQQPDGMFARFSEVVDNFTHYGMTRVKAYELCRHEMGTCDALIKVANAEANLGRWQEALEIIESVHGKEALDKVLAEMGQASASAGRRPTTALSRSGGPVDPKASPSPSTTQEK